MQSRIYSSAIALALTAALPTLAQADVPFVDHIGRPAIVTCDAPAGAAPIRAVHMDKIIFRLLGPITAVLAQDQAALDAVPRDSRLDIKVLDDPRTVADLKGKVLTFLHAEDTPANRLDVAIDDVDYSVVCPRVPNAAAGG